MKDKKGRFAAFWLLFGVLGILLIGSFITPFRIVLDDVFDRIETNAINNQNNLACTDPNAPGYIKATCFTLGGFMIIFILYLIFQWATGMVNGSKSSKPIFSNRYRQLQQALNE